MASSTGNSEVSDWGRERLGTSGAIYVARGHPGLRFHFLTDAYGGAEGSEYEFEIEYNYGFSSLVWMLEMSTNLVHRASFSLSTGEQQQGMRWFVFNLVLVRSYTK